MAYGARLESVLGASPRGFESPILRRRPTTPSGSVGFRLSTGMLPIFSLPKITARSDHTSDHLSAAICQMREARGILGHSRRENPSNHVVEVASSIDSGVVLRLLFSYRLQRMSTKSHRHLSMRDYQWVSFSEKALIAALTICFTHHRA